MRTTTAITTFYCSFAQKKLLKSLFSMGFRSYVRALLPWCFPIQEVSLEVTACFHLQQQQQEKKWLKSSFSLGFRSLEFLGVILLHCHTVCFPAAATAAAAPPPPPVALYISGAAAAAAAAAVALYQNSGSRRKRLQKIKFSTQLLLVTKFKKPLLPPKDFTKYQNDPTR